MILKLKPDIKCPWAGAVLQARTLEKQRADQLDGVRLSRSHTRSATHATSQAQRFVAQKTVCN